MLTIQKHLFVAGAIFFIVVLVIGGLWYNSTNTSVSESPVAKSPVVESLPPEPIVSKSPVSEPPTLKPTISKFPINSADTIVSWSFKGAYTGNDSLIAKADADIAHLKSLIGKGQYTDYDLYIGIGNANNLKGNGALAYQNYNRAISILPNKGLAYANLAHLMDNLGAYHTATDAYAKAVAVEPSVQQYKNARLDYLNWRFPEGGMKQ